jgi:F0F1-type ATP synthase gamma subunit
MEMGYKDVTVEQILPFVEQQITQELNEIFETAPEQTMEKLLEKYVGKKNIDKYRKVKLSKSKAKPVSGVKEIKDTGSTSSAPKADDVEIVSVKSLLGF